MCSFYVAPITHPIYYIEVPDAVRLYREHNSKENPSVCEIEGFLARCMDRKCSVAVVPVGQNVPSSKKQDLKEIEASVLEYMAGGREPNKT